MTCGNKKETLQSNSSSRGLTIILIATADPGAVVGGDDDDKG